MIENLLSGLHSHACNKQNKTDHHGKKVILNTKNLMNDTNIKTAAGELESFSVQLLQSLENLNKYGSHDCFAHFLSERSHQRNRKEHLLTPYASWSQHAPLCKILTLLSERTREWEPRMQKLEGKRVPLLWPPSLDRKVEVP